MKRILIVLLAAALLGGLLIPAAAAEDLCTPRGAVECQPATNGWYHDDTGRIAPIRPYDTHRMMPVIRALLYYQGFRDDPGDPADFYYSRDDLFDVVSFQFQKMWQQLPNHPFRWGEVWVTTFDALTGIVWNQGETP
jgi:hypothetical protein